MASSADGSARLRTRAYQLEMYERSLKANTIVVMGTGTGKTHIASLRIDEELRRTPQKQVWFTAPNAGLVDQQRKFLARELPLYRMRSLTGRENVDAWHGRIWKEVLKDVNVVVATPRVLFDALTHAYVRLQNISLLVFDEAHHCQANSPSALIMQKFYHPQKMSTGTLDLPHVLGLTASPCISDKSASMAQLEANLDATCRSPTVSVDEYAQRVSKAVLVRRRFAHVPQETSALLNMLEAIVAATRSDHDPHYQHLLKAAAQDDLHAAGKLRKYQQTGQTPAISELRKFLGSAQYLHESLGTWASNLYITTCVEKWHASTSEVNVYHDSGSSRHQRFIDELLKPLRKMVTIPQLPDETQVASKATELIRFLASAYQEDIAIIVFVERRSVAWALCQLLQASPLLNRYGIFSYVGSSLSKSATLHQICTTTTQEAAFSRFRERSRNLCIATSVAEEGFDVPAVNIVVRYDDPKQVVSYLQSRGRARQKDSKIVCFQDINAEQGKYELWDNFERAMEEQYQKQEKERLKRLEAERQSEEYDEIYQVEKTGARLDLNVSVSHLAHFCAKATAGSNDLVYLLEGEIGVAVSAKVLLPSCVPPSLREAHSCQAWRSERMAKRDAAFHAMKALHAAGLIDDHLMPFEEHKNSKPLVHEKKMREVSAEHQVWVTSDPTTRSFACRIEVSHAQKRYLSLVSILSTPLQETLRFPLWETPLREIEVSVVPLGQVNSCECELLEDVTQLLFKETFQDGSASGSLGDPSRLSCTILPEFTDPRLGAKGVMLQEFLDYHSWLRDLQPLLIWRKGRPRPYIWYPPHRVYRAPDGRAVLAARQIKKLRILSTTFGTELGKASLQQDKELLLEDCEARGIATVYGPTVLLLPSILHLMAAAIRAQHANKTVFRSIDFSSTELIVPALIANSASGTFNYERLEFLGDACLKYLASVQMFFNHPTASEGILTRKTHEIIGNTRLEAAVDGVGLVPFITTETPIQKHWKLPKLREHSDVPAARNIISKTLADVVESILGAAFLDGKKNGQSIEKCIAALRLFIPEVEWRAPYVHVHTSQNRKQSNKETQQSLLQNLIEKMFGCKYGDAALLAEALTHSTDDVSQPALDRLEFLGDAVLDQIIKVRLFGYSELEAGRLTLCRHALASHAYLAYRALSIHYDEVLQDIPQCQNGSLIRVDELRRVELTDLIKFQQASLRDPITVSKARYDAIKDAIEAELAAGRFPWTLLRSLDAPKVCSDIIESLLGALYLDSRGSLDRCEMLLERLGVMHLLDRMAENDGFEVRTPGHELRELCAERKIAVSIGSRCERDENNSRYIGEVVLEGSVCIIRKAACLEEAKSLVAEAAMEFLQALQKPQSVVDKTNDNDIDIDIVMSEIDRDEQDKVSQGHVV